MLEWHPNTQALAGAFAENVEAGLRGESADETVTAQCNQYKHDEGCDKDKLPHPSEWKPLIMPDKMKAEDARAELTKGIQVTNPLGEEVTLDKRLLEHWAKAGKEESDINERLSALPLIKEVVKNPSEIWENENGQRTYLASVIDEHKEKGKSYTVAFTLTSDNTVIETYFPNSNNAPQKRKGKLIYAKATAVVSGT